MHELVTGPINAGVFPNRDFDTTLGTESLFFFGANSASDVSTWQQAKSWMNFGAVEVNEEGALKMSVRDIVGNTVYENTLLPNNALPGKKSPSLSRAFFFQLAP